MSCTLVLTVVSYTVYIKTASRMHIWSVPRSSFNTLHIIWINCPRVSLIARGEESLSFPKRQLLPRISNTPNIVGV